METPRQHPLWFNFFAPKDDPTTELCKLWKETSLFEGIPEKSLRQLVDNMHSRSFQAGETIFSAGELGAGAIMIRSGGVAIHAGDNPLTELTRGDFFGEIALVVNEPRTATATAQQDSELVFFLQTTLQEWMEHSTHHGARFVLNLSRVLAARLRHANAQIENASSHVR